ncbi:hypothetical protein [Delftia tsuruhatensis]|uniref:hypothetical protein n=1 Tax=Delftia tsuruhatensis TaxID=180282 RepID=UPI003A8B64A4
MRLLFIAVPAIINALVAWLLGIVIGGTDLAQAAACISGLMVLCIGWSATTPRPERGEHAQAHKEN